MRFAEHSVNIVLSTTLYDAGIDLKFYPAYDQSDHEFPLQIIA